MAPKKSRYEQLLSDLESEEVIQEVNAGKRIGFYHVKQQLGAGAFARVKLAVHALVGAKVALKIVNKEGLDNETTKLLLQEIECMSKLTHPNITRLYEAFETPSQYYIATEFAPSGDLTDKIIKYKKLPEHIARRHFAQIMSGIEYMHDNNVIHRDIKTDNVLLSNDVCKLADFGFCTKSPREKLLTTFCGSPPYAAPELFKDDAYLGRNVDIWALGVTLYMMVTGRLPFHGNTLGKLKQAILACDYSTPGHLSPELVDLFAKLFKLYPQDRLTVVEMSRSIWMEGCVFSQPLASKRLKPPMEYEEKDEIEQLAVQELYNYGIRDDVIQNCPNDLSSPINGTFRLAYYQAERNLAREKAKKEELAIERRKKAIELRKQRNKSKMCSLI